MTIPQGGMAEHRRLVRLSVVLACLAVSVACERAAASSEIHVDALVQLVADPGARIGSVDDPNTGFSQVGGVDVDREGNVFVMEGSVPEIRVYSPEGQILRRIGRRGDGPGEFQSVSRFGVLQDTVWAVDLSLRRITLFDPQGAVLSTGSIDAVAVPLPQGYGYIFPWMMQPNGSFTGHFAMVAGNRDGSSTGVQPTDRIPVPLVLFDAAGAVTDTIGWADRPPPRMWRPPSSGPSGYQFVQIGERRQMVPRAPTTLPWWEPLRDGYLLVETPLADVADDAFFTVTRFGLSGDTVYSRAVHYHPEPYSAVTLDTIAARAARGDPGGGVPYSPSGRVVPDDWEAAARAVRAAMNFPRFQLPIQYPWVSGDESIWLRQWDGSSPVAHWFLMDEAGRPRGKMELPSDVQIRWSRGDTFWAVDLDEFDVPWLVRFTIRSS